MDLEGQTDRYMKVTMTIEVSLDPSMDLRIDDERIWAENEVFVGDRSLILHSNEIGDYIGEITKVSNLKWHE